MDEFNSKWRRDAKTGSALRLGDKTYLVLTDDGWIATHKSKVHDIPAPRTPNALEEAIILTDAFFTPPQWKFVEGQWIRDGWLIRAEQTGWYVYRTKEDGTDLASVQEFASADRARRWAEVRFDRTGTNLRGPKPRAGSKSNSKLPDVRVTETEKAEAVALLEDLGLTYSQFVRAALRFAKDHITKNPMDEDDWVVKQASGKASFISATSLTSEELDGMRADYRGSERSEEQPPSAPEPQSPDQATLKSNPFMHVKGLWPTFLHDE